VTRSTCLLCDVALLPGPSATTQTHPEVDDCGVQLTDLWGVAISDPESPAPAQPEPEPMLDITTFPRVEDVLLELFDRHDLPRLGGPSTGRGWSSFSTFQRCPYAWKRRYVDQL